MRLVLYAIVVKDGASNAQERETSPLSKQSFQIPEELTDARQLGQQSIIPKIRTPMMAAGCRLSPLHLGAMSSKCTSAIVEGKFFVLVVF
jgi:hypothetical protein